VTGVFIYILKQRRSPEADHSHERAVSWRTEPKGNYLLVKIENELSSSPFREIIKRGNFVFIVFLSHVWAMLYRKRNTHNEITDNEGR